jgi:inner membrane protein
VLAKNLKNKTILYGSILGTIPDLDVVVGLFFDPVNAVLIHRGISHSLFLFYFYLLLGGLFQNWKKG